MVAFLALRLPDSAALEYYKNLELGTKFLWYVCIWLSMAMQILIMPNISIARDCNEGRNEIRKEGRREERHFRGRPDESPHPARCISGH